MIRELYKKEIIDWKAYIISGQNNNEIIWKKIIL